MGGKTHAAVSPQSPQTARQLWSRWATGALPASQEPSLDFNRPPCLLARSSLLTSVAERMKETLCHSHGMLWLMLCSIKLGLSGFLSVVLDGWFRLSVASSVVR